MKAVLCSGCKSSFSILGTAFLDFKELACSHCPLFLWCYTKDMLHFQKKEKAFMNVQTVASSCERVCRHSQTFARGRKVVYLPCLSWYGLFGCGVWVLVHKGISRLQPWRGNAEGMQGILCPAHSLRCGTCCWDGIFWSRVHPESQHCHWVLITLRRKSPLFSDVVEAEL